MCVDGGAAPLSALQEMFPDHDARKCSVMDRVITDAAEKLLDKTREQSF